MYRKRYRELFSIRTTTDPRTGKTRRQASYTGPYYHIKALRASRTRWGVGMASALIVVSAVLLGYLFTDLPGTHSPIVLPFAVMLPLPLFYWGLGVFNTLRLTQRVTQPQLEESVLRVKRSATGAAVLCALYAVGAAALVLSGGAGGRWPAEAAFAAGMLAAGIVSLLAAKAARRLAAGKEVLP
jgi:hypothetical protein